jgi:hypothetical protein
MAYSLLNKRVGGPKAMLGSNLESREEMIDTRLTYRIEPGRT